MQSRQGAARRMGSSARALSCVAAIVAWGVGTSAHALPCDPCTNAAISGELFHDVAGDGVKNGTDGPLSGTVDVLTPEGVLFTTINVPATGQFSLTGLDCGNWILLANAGASWTLTSPPMNLGQHIVHLSAQGQSVTTADFGFGITQCKDGAQNLFDVINSGWDESAGQAMSVNPASADDDWILTASWPIDQCTDVNGNTVTQAHPINHPPLLPITTGSSAWHSAQPNSTWVTGWPGTNTPNGKHYYQHCFCLAPGYTDAAIDLAVYADDAAHVYLNGNHALSTPAPSFDPALTQPFSVTINDPSWFQEGGNCVTVVTENIDKIITGMNVTGTVTAENGQCCADLVEPGSISGVKWYDENQDGIRDPWEPLLAGWDMSLNGTTVGQTTTDGTGAYSFSPVNTGAHTVWEAVAPPGATGPWFQTYPGGVHQVNVTAGSQETGVDFGNAGPLCDVVQTTVSQNSTEGPHVCCWQLSGSTSLVNGISGAMTALSPNGNLWGVSSNAPLWTHQQTAQSVIWSPDPAPFAPAGQLQPGNFCVQTQPTAGPTLIEFSWLDWNQGAVCPETFKCGLEVSGTKFNDVNGNGVRDPGEPGIGGFVIELLDTNGNLLASTTTNADGSYLFSGLGPGLHVLQEVQQAGWSQTYPATGTWTFDPTTDPTTGLDFGNTKGEPVDPGECVEVIKQVTECGSLTPYLFHLSFLNISDFDIHEVSIVPIAPAGLQVTPNPVALPSTVSPGDIGSISVGMSGVTPGQKTCFHVAFHDELGLNCCSIEVCVEPPECPDCENAVVGTKFYDVNGNGVRDPGEVGLSGWTIVIEDQFGNQLSTTTDDHGGYAFTGLAHGTYTVTEVQQAGWTQTYPAGGAAHTIAFSDPDGGVALNVDFGNTKKKVIDPVDPTDPAVPADTSGSMKVDPDAMKVPMLPFVAAAPADEAIELRAVTVASAGSGDDASAIARVRLFRDINANGRVDAGEPELASGRFKVDDGVVTLALAESIVVDAGAIEHLLVAADFGGDSNDSAGIVPFDVAPWSPWSPWLVVGAAWLWTTRRRFGLVVLAAASLWACQQTPEHQSTYRLYLVGVDASGLESGRVVTVSDEQPISGPVVTIGQ